MFAYISEKEKGFLQTKSEEKIIPAWKKVRQGRRREQYFFPGSNSPSARAPNSQKQFSPSLSLCSQTKGPFWGGGNNASQSSFHEKTVKKRGGERKTTHDKRLWESNFPPYCATAAVAAAAAAAAAISSLKKSGWSFTMTFSFRDASRRRHQLLLLLHYSSSIRPPPIQKQVQTVFKDMRR